MQNLQAQAKEVPVGGASRPSVIQTRSLSKVFQIGHQRMFDGRFHKALAYMRAGELGPITQMRAYWHRNLDWRRKAPSPELERLFNWRLYRQLSGGLMTELASHHLHVTNSPYVSTSRPFNGGRKVGDEDLFIRSSL